MSLLRRPELFLAILPILSVACNGTSEPSGPSGPAASLRRFGSETELTEYLQKADAASGAAKGSSSGGYADSGASAPTGASEPSGASSSAPAPPNETITNNQEAGVDEGGIVKNIGDALVVLRKGRLYAVSVAQAGQPVQTDSIAVAADAALNSNVWYDEMLVRGDRLYVIGYRYGLKLAGADATTSGSWNGATEVASFRLAGGKLERLKTLFLESNDYYSGSNYASRMIDGKLVFYMPHGAWKWKGSGPGGRALHIPTYFTSNGDGTFAKGAPIFTPTDVYVPIDVPTSPVFHTVVKCELPDDGGFTCGARSLLSNWGREHYVTPGAVFLWSLPRAYMFRFDDLGVVAHKAAATPRDQFSFKEKDGVLHMVGTSWRDPKSLGSGVPSGAGDAPVAAPSGSPSTYTPPKLVVESLPIADFDVLGDQSLDGKERAVAVDTSSSWISKNRFVGDSLFLGVGNKVARFELASGATTSLDVAGTVVRIEPLGAGRALVAVQGAAALDLQSLPVAGALAPQGSARLDGLAQGESRSHGFFFKPGAGGAGTFGLPVMNDESGGGYYGNGISNIGFWSVGAAGELGGLGVVSSSKETGVCETSCTDWYGNTRPIFLGERAFALMGSELAEIAIAPAAGRIGTPAVLTK